MIWNITIDHIHRQTIADNQQSSIKITLLNEKVNVELWMPKRQSTSKETKQCQTEASEDLVLNFVQPFINKLS